MRKSFTWFLSLMFLLSAFAPRAYAQDEGGETQETIELYAEEASQCYGEDNIYEVAISVRDFIKISKFQLTLDFDDEVFSFEGITNVHPSLGSAVSAISSSGAVVMTWSGTATTIGDNVKTEIITLQFAINGFPGSNVSSSYSTDLAWDVDGADPDNSNSNFWYLADTEEVYVLTKTFFDGSLDVNVGVDISQLQVEFSTETCAGGDVIMTVTAPDAAKYLFNEGSDPEEWVWVTSPQVLAEPGDQVIVRLMDANGCISLPTKVTVPETIAPVSFEAESHNPSCFGEKGLITIHATGGTAPYTYYVSENADGSGAVTKTHFSFTMAPGTYYVAVQDANECADLEDIGTVEEGYWQEVEIVDNNNPVTVEVYEDDVQCFGGSDGSVTVVIVGEYEGDEQFWVSLNNGPWKEFELEEGNSYLFEDLAVGEYTAVVKNSAGCEFTAETVEITQPEPITFDMEIVDVACGGEIKGSIIVTNIEGGKAPYTVVVVEAGTTLELTEDDIAEGGGAVIGDLNPNYHSLTIIDENGCEVEYDNPNGTGNVISVQSDESIKFKVNVTNPLCNDEDATVTVTNITGGTGSYVILFNGEPNEEAPANVFVWEAPYEYLTVTVQNEVEAGDNNTCAVEIDVPAPLNPGELAAAVRDFFPPTCIEGNDGSIRLDISGGTEPYEYSINGSSWKPAVFTNDLVNIRVPVGTHEILVRDKNGCEIAETIEVEIDLDASVITAASDKIIECYGQREGTISVDFDSWADGLENDEPVREVEFWVRNPDGTESTFVPFNYATPTTPATKFYAGTYYVWVVDQYTCKSNEVKVDVKQNPKLIIDDVVANGASCYGTFEGTINIYAKGGTLGQTGLQYAIVNNEGALGNIQEDKWLPFDVVSGTNSSVSTHVDGGTYWIAVRDDGCDEVYYGPVVVDGYAELLVDDDEIKATDPLCHGDENGTITVPAAAISGGAGSYVFTLYVQEGEDWVAVEEYTEVPFGSFTGLPGGTYKVFVGDAKGCPGYETEEIHLNNPQELTFGYIYYHFSCYGSNDGIIELYPTGGTDGKYYYAINNPNVWLPFKDQDGSDYYKIYIATEPGTYTIWVKDDNDCTTEPVEITIEQPEPLDAEITITHVKCHGGDDGEITVEGLGGWEGLSAYWFKVDNGSWEGPTTDPITFDGLEAGEHTLYVAQDDYDLDEPYQWWTKDCEVAIPFVIEEPDAIEFDVKITNVSCKDGSDGAFTIEWITGGTPWVDEDGVNHGYYVNLTGDNYDSGWIWTGGDYSHIFTDLPHSHYSLLIKDANGCELLPPAVPSPTEGPYKTKESWEVQEPATYLTLEAEHINNVSCYGGEDGKFVLHASGGTAPYQYFTGLSVPPEDDQHILVPDPEDEGWQESNEFIVGAGTWVTWVMDANGCIVGGEYENGIPVNEWRVQILQPDEIVAELDEWRFYEPACYGNWDGAIGIWVTGGSGEYSFTLTGTSADGQPVELVYNNPDLWYSEGGWDFYVLDGVPASTQAGFDIVVTDSNDCDAATVNVRVTQPEPLSVSLIKSEGSFTCADSNEGWIETSVTGGPEYGDVEYQLLKDGVLHTAWQDISGAFLVQIGHEYTVQVRIGGWEWETGEPIYCEAEATIDIAPVAEVVIAEIDDRTCYGDETPKAVVTATAEEGRTLELRYQEVLGEGLYGPWSSWVEFNEGEGENTHVITDELTYGDETEFEGHFNFQVRDEEGCESELVFMTFVPVQHPVHADYEIVEETECTATVEITHITGGVAPYVVLVNGEALGEEEAIVLPRGAQVLSIVDAHQCVYEIEVDVVGEYVTREVTIETLYGESVEFTDELAGVEETLEAGEYSYIYVDEDSGCERELIVEVVEIPWPIATVQGEGEESPAVGKVVQVVGTVTGVAEGEGFFMQDANAPWSGIWVPWADAADYEIGDGVAVVGEVDEISSVTSLVAEEVEGVEPPLTVVAIDLGSPEDAKDEQYESVLVKVSGARATAADEGTGEWTIFTEEGNEVVVNDWLYDFAPDAGNFYNVTGIVNTRMEDFKLEPRIEPDIEDLTATAVGPELTTNDFRVYPNPFINEIKIENIEKLTRVVVSNIAGQRVIDIAFPVQEIPTSKLASGVYVVSMFTESGLAKTERIVKR